MNEAAPDEQPGPGGGDESAEAERTGALSGLQLLGVVRARPLRGPMLRRDEPPQAVRRVRYRDLEALVRPTAFRMPPFDHEHIRLHQEVVDRAMRRTTVLPVPYGVVFRGRGALIRFLEDQYLVLDDGLSLFEGHWEVRLHVAIAASGEATPETADVAAGVYTELRRFARAAVPFPREDGRLMSAAFLVPRNSWIEFVERIDELGASHDALSFDVTGPWPPYDFVRVIQ